VSTSAVLEAICSGISQGLGFGRAVVQLRAGESDVLEPVEAFGASVEDVRSAFTMPVDDLERLLDPAFEREGCYLLTHEEGVRRVPAAANAAPSPRNGRGPAAWNRHWLFVPLIDRTGARLGAVWVDGPADLLLPSRERLQALRLFANQATTALESSAQYATMRVLADRDPLTKLLNRRAFARHLDAAADRGRDSGQPLSLVYCDLDGFKAVNDTRGHADGDRLLRSFSDALTAAVRQGDSVFRMGGDEFALLLEGCPRERAGGRRARPRAPRRERRRRRLGGRGQLRRRGDRLHRARRQRRTPAAGRRRDVRRQGLALGPQHRGLTRPAAALAFPPAGR
jgi:GGDEF domain-containing protein